MNQKILKLAGEFLDSYADRLGNDGCNDWDWPADWSEDERLKISQEMVASNIRKTVQQLTESELIEAYELAKRGPPNWWMVRYLADIFRSVEVSSGVVSWK